MKGNGTLCDLNRFFEQLSSLSEAITNSDTQAQIDLRDIAPDCMEQAKDLQVICAEKGLNVKILH